MEKPDPQPHGFRDPVFYGSIGYGNGQTDFWGAYDSLHFDRNFTFGDGHVTYISANSRAGTVVNVWDGTLV